MATRKAAKKKSKSAEQQRLGRLRKLVDILEKSELSELAYEDEDISVILKKGGHTNGVAPATYVAPAPVVAAQAAPAAAAAAEPVAEDEGVEVVRSPFVGTFYRSPSPDSPPYTDVGKRVAKGQTVCIVEAMKLMNEIESELEGTVVEVLVENAQPVQYGDPLFKVRVS